MKIKRYKKKKMGQDKKGWNADELHRNDFCIFTQKKTPNPLEKMVNRVTNRSSKLSTQPSV